MSTTVTQQSLFKPAPSRNETRADTTNKIARSIIDAGAAKIEARTAKLKQAQLEQEARQVAEAPVAEASRAKPAAKHRAVSAK